MIPILFIYSNLITGSITQVLLISAVAVFALYFMVGGFEGYLHGKLSVVGKAACFAVFIAALVATFTNTANSLRIILLAGSAVLALLVLILQGRNKKATKTE